MSIELELAGKTEAIPAVSFVVALENFWDLLHEVDTSISGRRFGSIRWDIVTLHKQSPAKIGFQGHPTRKKIDFVSSVQRNVVNGIAQLATSPEPPQYYSHGALRRLLKIAKQHKRLEGISVSTAELTVSINRAVLRNVEFLLGGGSKSLGSITGSLDALTLHSGTEFRIWSERYPRPIACRFKQAQYDKVLTCLKQPVIVWGQITRNAKGYPVFVQVDDFEPAGDPGRLPSIRAMSGFLHDVTEGKTLKEYMETLRDG